MGSGRSWHWAVGLMSGTSADGVDAALVRIRLCPLKLKLVAFQTYAYRPSLHRKVLLAAEGQLQSSEDIALLNQTLGKSFAEAVHKICGKGKIDVSKVSWIGSHGQTVFHSPKTTLQLGEPAIIAARTGVVTVADFRQADMGVGGLGAPLTPYFNFHFFHQVRQPIIFQNIGGIANLTYLPARKKIEKVMAFDTGPGNMVIDGVVRQLTVGRKRYDRNGRMAERGSVHRGLVQKFAAEAFIRKVPPKACGREQYGAAYVARIMEKARRLRLSADDTVASVTALTACSIADNCRRFIFRKGRPEEMIVGGGGAKNRTLLWMLAKELPELQVMTADERGLPSDAAEAIAFAFLAGETLAGRPSNLPQVTGAKRAVVLGKIVKP